MFPRARPLTGALIPILLGAFALACEGRAFDLTGKVSLSGLSGDGGPTADAPPAVLSSIGQACQGPSGCQMGETCSANVPGGGYCTSVCTLTGSCPAGATCVEGSAGVKVCIKSCQPPAGCRAEHVCDEGLCIPRCASDADCSSAHCDPKSGACLPSRVGGACSQNLDCGQHPAFCDTTRPEGYCSLPCGGPMNIRCPRGATCSSAGGAQSCLSACTGPADCRSGFLCAGDPAAGRSCVPRCTANDDCPAGLRCDVASGGCLPGGPAPGQLGSSCTTDAECAAVGAGARCLTGGNGFPGGYCTTSCLQSACPGTGACVELAATTRLCFRRCAASADCRAHEQTCTPIGSAGASAAICLPPCTSDTDCGPPAPVCDRTSGLCVERTTTSPVLITETVDLTPTAPVSVGTMTLTDRLVLTVPADAISINFVGQAISDPAANLVLYRLEQSTNDFAAATRLYDYASINSQMKLPPPVVPGAFSVLYPNSPSVPFVVSSPGTTVKVGIRLLASRPTTAKVTAIVKRGPTRALTEGKIDLNLFFVGLPELNATTARTDARFQMIFGTVKEIWARAGVGVRNVNYLDITGADATRFSDLDERELGPLMTLSRDPGATDNALNVFFVHAITGSILDGYVILGASTGLPGVPLRGTNASGMAVTTADFPAGLDQIAETWAHEGGHWLGLFHTTESGGAAFDPLPDTAECAQAQHDANADKVLQPGECQGRGADNLMFWTSVKSIVARNLTPNQSFVLLRSPAVH